jgi:IS30 family transposase
MKKYSRITLSERENIYRLLKQDHNQTTIAKSLGRHKSSISRELKRCVTDSLGYIPDRSNIAAINLSKIRKCLFDDTTLKTYVISKLKLGWSPEAIAGRLKYEDSDLQVSHETIYKFIYCSNEGIQNKLYSLLTRQKPKRTRWHSRKPKKSHIPESASIAERPKVIEKRKRKGHWEGDLVVFGSLKSANITTLVERKSRFVKLVHNTSKYTNEVIGGIKNTMKTLPTKYRKTITFDRGTEFASYRNLELTTYFCNPHSPWQKGSNENFNGRLRRYLPKTYNPKNLSQALLDKISNVMNNQPRKCLGFKTPSEVFHNRRTYSVALDP